MNEQPLTPGASAVHDPTSDIILPESPDEQTVVFDPIPTQTIGQWVVNHQDRGHSPKFVPPKEPELGYWACDCGELFLIGPSRPADDPAPPPATAPRAAPVTSDAPGRGAAAWAARSLQNAITFLEEAYAVEQNEQWRTAWEQTQQALETVNRSIGKE